MFKRVLVPVDFSEKSRTSLDIAIDMARHYQGDIDLLHVIETLVDVEFSELEEFYSKLEKRALKNMNALVATHKDASPVINVTVVFGNRTQEILKFADQRKTGIIIMHSHVVDPERPTQSWGTISYKVALLSQCPVMLVK
ncbi:MAG: universal stress protein [Syntrophales bacterium]|jgi:universal stress protein A|nr:universal stress protein [Syntrophales bacterium]MCK9527431.1 universal stress protein [Syntrophales bacterium]MDX9921533.1 universal stress protein [Syntrophales bacterium]